MTKEEAQRLYAELWWDTFSRVFPFAIVCAGVAPDDISRMRAKKEYEAALEVFDTQR